MKKIILIMLITLSFVLIGCESSTEDNSLKDIIDRDLFVVGYTEFPPMGYQEDNEVVGFDIELATAVSEKLGVQVEFKYIDWNSKVLELESGRIDAIWNGMTITEDRKLEMTFSQKYLDNNLIILTLKNSTIDNLEDLSGKVVGVESTSSGQIALEANQVTFESLEELKEYDTISSALLALESSIIDAIIVDEIYARYYVLKNSDKFEIGEEIVGVEEYGIGFLKGSIKLRDEVDRIIDELAEEGTVEVISDKWFGENLFRR